MRNILIISDRDAGSYDKQLLQNSNTLIYMKSALPGHGTCI